MYIYIYIIYIAHLMGKSAISMAIFNSYVADYQRVIFKMVKTTRTCWRSLPRKALNKLTTLGGGTRWCRVADATPGSS
jgi:hypothetical protein